MRKAAVSIFLALSLVGVSPAYAQPQDPSQGGDVAKPPDPGRYLRPGERYLFTGWSKCWAELKVCRVERDQLKEDKKALEARVVELESRPPETRTPGWVWPVMGAAVALTAIVTGSVVAATN